MKAKRPAPWAGKLPKLTKRMAWHPEQLEWREYILNNRLLEAYYERLAEFNRVEQERLTRLQSDGETDCLPPRKCVG